MHDLPHVRLFLSRLVPSQSMKPHACLNRAIQSSLPLAPSPLDQVDRVHFLYNIHISVISQLVVRIIKMRKTGHPIPRDENRNTSRSMVRKVVAGEDPSCAAQDIMCCTLIKKIPTTHSDERRPLICWGSRNQSCGGS